MIKKDENTLEQTLTESRNANDRLPNVGDELSDEQLESVSGGGYYDPITGVYVSGRPGPIGTRH